MNFSIRMAIAATTLIAPLPTHAAEFTQFSDQPLPFAERFSGTCTHRMDGPIDAGDADAFQAMIDALPDQFNDDMNFMICLNSEGGRIEEGLKIGRIIQDNFFGTYVDDGDTCLSACAIAFMHGTIGAWEYILTLRMMHPNATLGFHAPSLDVGGDPGAMVPFLLVQAAYQATLQTMSDIVESASQQVSEFSSPVVPMSLLTEMLEVGPDDFTYVDTLHKAFMWDITIFPKSLKAPPGFELDVGIYQLCENSSYKINPNSFSAEPPRSIDRSDVEDGNIGYPWDVDLPTGYKLVSPNNIFNRQCGYAYFSEHDFFKLRRYVDGELEREVWMPPVYLFAPATRIRDITSE
ncbi:hypothetical protein [Rhodovulum sulfidophilum]|uniref:COG3904 family protein n=1 Tax=Rhodovulum sulfidophilum TaxID=35806 RepID=UPI001389939A|nr:hypothetical protein [Rhodovulum sulfidophilum]NDK37048.1 hypothetical protein [Rhodovulum sulfidophilum]